jgi:hypothetical protein
MVLLFVQRDCQLQRSKTLTQHPTMGVKDICAYLVPGFLASCLRLFKIMASITKDDELFAPNQLLPL